MAHCSPVCDRGGFECGRGRFRQESATDCNRWVDDNDSSNPARPSGYLVYVMRPRTAAILLREGLPVEQRVDKLFQTSLWFLGEP
jgi:hypothetical protein